MKYYRKPAGHYIELEDSTPVSKTLIPVCQRPSKNHTFSDNWQSDPLNPLVCWTINLADHKTRKHQAINIEAHRRIVQYYGLLDGKQSNMQKRGLEIIRKRAMLVALTTAEATEEDALLQAGQYIDAVRIAAKTAKQAVADATSVAQVDAVTVAWPITVPPNWPL